MSVKEFENLRWKTFAQPKVFRHEAAADMIDGGSVLDLGCGDGLFLEMLQKKGIKAKGLDISEEAVNKCKEKGLEAQIFDFTSNALPFFDSAFDCVVLLDVLEHLYAPSRLLKEAARVSKKYFIIGVPNFNSLPARIQMLLGKIPENNRPHKGHIYWFNYKNLKNILKQNHLEIVDLKINTIWENQPLVGSLLRLLADKFPQIFALSFVVKAKKK